MTIAFVVLAGGRGLRLGGQPKQLRLLGGKPLWRWSFDTALGLLDERLIDEIVLVMARGDLTDELKNALPAHVRTVEGGAERSLSALNALRSATADTVLLHDAARPFVSAELCHRIVAASDGTNAVIPLLPEPNALKKVSGGQIASVDRDGLYITQTPQLFPRAELLRLLEDTHDFAIKDEAELWLRCGKKLVSVEGDSLDFKITQKGDWQMACALTHCESERRTGLGYDIHPLVPGRPLILGGIAIPSPLGLNGHSDADALCHAVADALLSGAGLPDIGTLYPASDPKYTNADSMKLLADAVSRVRAEGWRIDWVSAVLTAQTPRLAPWKEPIVASLVSVLGTRCSVTFKSGEHIGDVGGAEAIRVWASANISRENS